MNDDKPEWMAKHEQSDLLQFESIHTAISGLPTKDDLQYVFVGLQAQIEKQQEKLATLIEARSNVIFLFKSALGIGALATAWLAIKNILSQHE